MSKKKFVLKSAYGKIGLMLILLLTGLIALTFGSSSLSAEEILMGLLRKTGYETQSIILYNVRLPRIIGAALSGVGLSISGVLLQTVTGNALASPNIIGVNAGAGFGVILALFLMPENIYALPFVAFAGAFLTTLLIVSIASGVGVSGSAVILSGIAVTAVLNAGISFLSYLDSDLLSTYNYFSVGGLSSLQAEELTVPFIIICICLFIAVYISGKTDTLCLGDSIALSLGVNVKKVRLLCLVLASASAASVVSFAGLLGFVGLVVPHIARKLVGNQAKDLLTVSSLLGAILMICADLIGRTAFSPSEIPVGIVTALTGAPFFLWLLFRRKNNV